MQSRAKTVEEYLLELPEDRRAELEKVRNVVLKHLPKGYEETMQYGMIGYVVPLKTYPKGYLGRKNEPLPYAGLASQKNSISVYLMGAYAGKGARGRLEKAFRSAGKKLDMGKSCIRLKSTEGVPLGAIGREIAAVPVSDFISFCEKAWAKRGK